MSSSQLYQNARPPVIPGDANLKDALVGDRLKLPIVSVTQETSATTTVSVEGASFAVTTVDLAPLAVDTAVSFTVENSYLSPLNNTQVSIVEYGGEPVTNGVPYVYLSGYSDGSVVVNVVNIGTAVLDGALTMHFVVA